MVLSFSRALPPKMSDTTIDFSPGDKKYAWNDSAKAFEPTTLSGTTDPNIFYYYELSPIDGIYYRSTDPEPFSITKKGTQTILDLHS